MDSSRAATLAEDRATLVPVQPGEDLNRYVPDLLVPARGVDELRETVRLRGRRPTGIKATIDHALGHVLQHIALVVALLLKWWSRLRQLRVGNVHAAVAQRPPAGSALKAIAWHPHVARGALALQDNSIALVELQKMDGDRAPEASVARLVRSDDSRELWSPAQQSGITCLAWQPMSSTCLAVGCESGVLLWQQHLVASHLPVLSGQDRCTWRCTPLQWPSWVSSGSVTALCWSPCGRFLVAGALYDPCVAIWDATTGWSHLLPGVAGGAVTLLKWSPCGQFLFAGTAGSMFRVWETTTWRCLVVGDCAAPAQAAVWSPDGRILFVAAHGKSYISTFLLHLQDTRFDVRAVPLDFDAGNDMTDYLQGGTCTVREMSLDPTGERLAVSFFPPASSLSVQPGIALYAVRMYPAVEISPRGVIWGASDQLAPSFLGFVSGVECGAMLAAAFPAPRSTSGATPPAHHQAAIVGCLRFWPCFFRPSAPVQTFRGTSALFRTPAWYRIQAPKALCSGIAPASVALPSLALTSHELQRKQAQLAAAHQASTIPARFSPAVVHQRIAAMAAADDMHVSSKASRGDTTRVFHSASMPPAKVLESLTSVPLAALNHDTTIWLQSGVPIHLPADPALDASTSAQLASHGPLLSMTDRRLARKKVVASYSSVFAACAEPGTEPTLLQEPANVVIVSVPVPRFDNALLDAYDFVVAHPFNDTPRTPDNAGWYLPDTQIPTAAALEAHPTRYRQYVAVPGSRAFVHEEALYQSCVEDVYLWLNAFNDMVKLMLSKVATPTNAGFLRVPDLASGSHCALFGDDRVSVGDMYHRALLRAFETVLTTIVFTHIRAIEFVGGPRPLPAWITLGRPVNGVHVFETRSRDGVEFDKSELQDYVCGVLCPTHTFCMPGHQPMFHDGPQSVIGNISDLRLAQSYLYNASLLDHNAYMVVPTLT